MAEKKKKVEKTEEEILFPEAKVGKYTIKPWSFGMLFDISPLLDQVIQKLEEKKIDVDMTGEDIFFSFQTIAKLFTVASQPVLEIMKMTLSIEEEEIKNLDMDTGIRIAIVIAKQNWSTVKNAFGPLLPKVVVGDEEENSQ